MLTAMSENTTGRPTDPAQPEPQPTTPELAVTQPMPSAAQPAAASTTEATAPAAPTAQPTPGQQPTPGPQPTATAQRPFWQRTWVRVTGGVLAGLAIFGVGFGVGWVASPDGDRWDRGDFSQPGWGGMSGHDESGDGSLQQRPDRGTDHAAPTPAPTAPDGGTTPSDGATTSGS